MQVVATTDYEYESPSLLLHDSKELSKESKSLELSQLKTQFKHIFIEPTTLPPPRGLFDHRIPLEPNARPVNIRPYRYPLRQRDIIENLIQELLERGVIQESNNPYASPLVLLGKKDCNTP